MLDRRRFVSMVTAAALAPRRAPTVPRTVLYAAVGSELAWYDVDVDGAALARRGSVVLPAAVQYAWPHASRRYLYVASSTGNAAGPGVHHVSAFRVDPASGALAPHGEPVALRARPIHLTTDAASEHVLVAYNAPSGVTVHRVGRDGTLGAEVPQPGPIDGGVYAHQVRVTSDGALAILVTRGNDATAARAEEPGALKVFRLRRGVLTDEVSIAPDGGYGFGPRHLDLHPTRPWVYVSLERQNQLWVFRRDRDTLAPRPAYVASTLRDPRDVRPGQRAGAIHVHPSGRWVYVANRADATTRVDGVEVFAGGENAIAVYAVDSRTGEPTLVQHADTRGIHARTFHLDPTGRLLVAAHVAPVHVRDGATVRVTPASLALFRVGDDGRLAFARSYEVEVGAGRLFWVGMVALAPT